MRHMPKSMALREARVAFNRSRDIHKTIGYSAEIETESYIYLFIAAGYKCPLDPYGMFRVINGVKYKLS